MSQLAYALAAVSKGFHIFPCEPGGKRPRRMFPNRPEAEAPWPLKWGELATNHVPTIIQWWRECPDSNIGIACKPSGLLVVDCDMKPPHDGWLEWVDIAGKYDPEWFLAPTLLVRTGGSGTHLYYRWPPGVQASQAGLSKHVDIRSNGGSHGGYVLGHGSVTSKGAYRTEEDEPVGNAPAWLVELCRERPRPPRQQSPYAQPQALSFAGLATAVARAAEGDRNACLLWAARSMCSDGASLDDALANLVPAATGNGLTERESTDTIRSAFRLQERKEG